MSRPANPRFIADETLGKLSRYIRMYGFDCKYLHSNSGDPLLCALEEDRILLTRRRSLLKECNQWSRLVCFDPASDQIKIQFANLVAEFDLDLSARLQARCPLCNHQLEIKDSSSLTGAIPDYILEKHSKLYQCTKCSKIYWQGSHMEHFLDRI